MSYAKRDYCMLFAKEDIRRANNSETSVSNAIMKASEADDQLKKFAQLLRARAPRNGTGTPLKTTDAWQRRVVSVTMPVLKAAAQRLSLLNDDEDSDSVSIDNLKLPVDDGIVLETSSARSAVSVATTARGERRVADDGDRSAVSVATTTARGERRAADDDGSRSAVSVATGEQPKDDDGSRSVATTPARKKQATALDALNHVTEADIRRRYSDNKAKLLQLKTDGALRQEQYNRKYAMLQVAYWSELDKLRNNATPTEINV